MGAAVGGAAGLAGGFLLDQYRKSEERAYQQGYQAGKGQR
jgi:hypothetical protein